MLDQNAVYIPMMTRCPSFSGSSASSVTDSDASGPSNQKRKTKSRPSKVKTPLPLDFQPSENTVLCGRSRECFESAGNRRFRVLCNSFMQDYLDAPGKVEKSRIVTKIMRTIRQSCPVGAFVSFEGGRWYEVSQRTAREKVGSYFRDSLHMVYRSSAKAKQARKRAETDTSSTNTKPAPANVAPPTVAAALASAAMAPMGVAAFAPFPAPVPRAQGVDIIDMNLLDCIAPVENEDVNQSAYSGPTSFWEVAHAV